MDDMGKLPEFSALAKLGIGMTAREVHARTVAEVRSVTPMPAAPAAKEFASHECVEKLMEVHGKMKMRLAARKARQNAGPRLVGLFIKEALMSGGEERWGKALAQMAESAFEDRNPLRTATVGLLQIAEHMDLDELPPMAAKQFLDRLESERYLSDNPEAWILPEDSNMTFGAENPETFAGAKAAWEAVGRRAVLAPGPRPGMR